MALLVFLFSEGSDLKGLTTIGRCLQSQRGNHLKSKQ
jgi:hypothetical protein